MDILSLNIKDTNILLQNKRISSKELVSEYISRIKKYDKTINAFTSLNEGYALNKAEQIDKKGDFSNPLCGIPFTLKDNFCSKESESTACSNILKDFCPPYESTVVKKLKDSGAIVLGKTNTDEFTMGSSTETSIHGVTKNPWDKSRVAGGSSGGPVAAVVSNMCMFSLGTDTGGSIRQPSSLCGATGLKVTYGRTSRFGVMSMASSLDSIGPIAKSAEDIAIILRYIAGHDPKDSTTPKVEVPDYIKHLDNNIKGLKIGLPKEYFVDGIDKEVKEAIETAITNLKELGAEIIEVSLPNTKYVLPVYYVIVSLEVSSNMARYDGIRYGLPSKQSKDLVDHYFQTRSKGFGKEVKNRIMVGTYIHSLGYDGAYYIKAQKVRKMLLNEYNEAFRKVDVILSPSTPEVAFKIGEKNSDPVKMYLSDIFTVSANLVGMPCISIPCGFTTNNLPIGMQLLGPQFSESKILKVANTYQNCTEWHKKRPLL